MSFVLSVYTPEITESLSSDWLSALATQGLICEFHPTFTINDWFGGFLPMSVRVSENSCSNSGKYGENKYIAGFELDIDTCEKSTFEIDNNKHIKICNIFLFRTAMRRSVIDLRIQCFAAATLANITNGVVVDHQSNKKLTGKEALKNAEREATEYEEFYKESFLQLPTFSVWR